MNESRGGVGNENELKSRVGLSISENLQFFGKQKIKTENHSIIRSTAILHAVAIRCGTMSWVSECERASQRDTQSP